MRKARILQLLRTMLKKKKNNTNDYYTKFVQYLEQIETELKNK